MPEHIFVLESLGQLTNSFNKFLRGSRTDMTKQEAIYFEVVSLLCTLIPLAATSGRTTPVSPVLAEIVNAVKASLETLQIGVASDNEAGVSGHVSLLSSMHAVAIFRDTAAAAQQAAQWILALNEREKERDRSGKSNLPKDIVAQVKALQAATEAALKEGSSWIKTLRAGVISRDFEPQVRRWIFEGEEGVLKFVGGAAVGSLVRYWEENIKGWMQVKWA
jgi:N-terminal acetyltransferase B complex non-catalytic subunit